MNIFKILANGKGTIKEPSVSAFLAYLLDPKENHGLGFEFIKRIIELSNSYQNHDNVEKYEYQVFLEQAFSQFGDKKQIVDIVILCFKNDTKNKKERIASISIENQNILKRIFLIENKINNYSVTHNQLLEQYNALKYIKDTKNVEIFCFYVTPNFDKFISEFENQTFDEKFHLFWKGKDGDSIRSILMGLLEDETNGLIEPVSEYTKHTIKAFIQFINSDFKSVKENLKERKFDGKYSERHRNLNLNHDLERKLKELMEFLSQKNNSIRIEQINLEKKPRDPGLRVYVNNIVITLWAGYEKRDKVSFSFTTNIEFSESKKSIEILANKLGLTIKKAKYSDCYIRTSKMQKPILLENKEEIDLMLKDLIIIVEKYLK